MVEKYFSVLANLTAYLSKGCADWLKKTESVTV